MYLRFKVHMSFLTLVDLASGHTHQEHVAMERDVHDIIADTVPES